MKKILFFGLALVMLATGCTKETTTDLMQTKRTIGVSIDDVTRTSLSDGSKFLWSKGDVIRVISLQTSEYEDVIIADEFVGKDYLGIQTSIQGQVMLIYPAEAYDGESNMISLPTSQDYVASSIANNLSVLYGVTASDKVSLSCAQSFFKISTNEAIREIIMEAPGEEPVSGIFNFDYKNGLSAYAGHSSIRVANIAEGTKELVLAVPGGEYTKGFKFTILGTSDNNYRVATAYASTGKTLQEGRLVTMPELNVSALAQATEIMIPDLASFKAFLDNASAASADMVYALTNDIDCGGEELTPAASFSGTFNGNGFAIKNAKISALFTSINAGAVVKNVVIDKSVTPVTGTVFGFVATTNAGTVKGCVNNADVVITSDIAATAHIGAIVGECTNTGRVFDCINNGNIQISVSSIGKQAYIGGVIGQLNFSVEEGSDVLVSNCINNGDVIVETGSAGSIFVAGVLAGNNAQKVANAKNLGKIENCINKGAVSYSFTNLASGTYANVGGVISYFEGDVKNLKNYGKVKYTVPIEDPNANGTCAGCAGVVCNLIYSATDCENWGDVEMSGRWAAGTGGNAGVGGCKQTAFAGVIAKHGTAYDAVADNDTPIVNCSNYGKLTGNLFMKTGGGTATFLGGVVGSTNCSLKNLSNYGDIDAVAGGKTNYWGGIVGYYGGVYIEDCVNSANLTVAGNEDVASALELGGIIGLSKMKNTVINRCSNGGTLTFNDVASTTESYQYFGGILANYDGNTQIISNCTNKGDLISNCTRKIRVAGIASSLYDNTTVVPALIGETTDYDDGTPGVNNITDCLNSGNITLNGAGNPADTQPGSIVGGITAYGSTGYTRCTNTGNITLNGCAANTTAGLIVGAANRCYNVSDCLIEGTITSDVATNSLGFFAGMPYESAEASYGVRYYLGSPEAVKITENAKINGVGISSPATVAQLCGGEFTNKDFQFKIVDVKTPNDVCEVSAIITKFTDLYPGEDPSLNTSYLACKISGKNLTLVKSVLADTETIGYYLEKGYTLQQLAVDYGELVDESHLNQINAGKHLVAYSGLDQDTEYKLIVYAENNEGKSNCVTSTARTEKLNHIGKLKLGDYLISDTANKSSQIFTLSSLDGGTENYLITNLANYDDWQWHAKYNEKDNTLTLDGTALEYESYGSLWLYGLYTIQDYNVGYAIGATGVENLVFNIDPNTHEPISINQDIMLFAAQGGKIAGSFRYFEPESTTVTLYSPMPSTKKASALSLKKTDSQGIAIKENIKISKKFKSYRSIDSIR